MFCALAVFSIFAAKQKSETKTYANSQIFQMIIIIGLKYRLIGRVGRVLANDPGDLGSIPSRILPKTFKMVLDTSLLNTQQYKVRIKGKVE